MERGALRNALAVWNALKQIDVNDLDFRNKNVEKVTKDIVAKASASEELQEITMSVTPTEEQEAVLKMISLKQAYIQ